MTTTASQFSFDQFMTFWAAAREVQEADPMPTATKGFPRLIGPGIYGPTGMSGIAATEWSAGQTVCLLMNLNPNRYSIGNDHRLLIDIVPSKRRKPPRNIALATSFGHADDEEI